MICSRCGVDSRRKERTAGRCPHCGGQFAFKQGRTDPISDVSFARAIEAVSGRGQVRWGVEHLYYEVSRRARRARSGAVTVVPIFFMVVLAIGIIVATKFALWAILVTALAVPALSSVLIHAQRRWNMRKDVFDDLWKRWRMIHGSPKGVIARRQDMGQAAPRAVEPDLNLYSFDRAVICDRARTVDLLLANNFHFENNCAVLSVDGYPSAAFATVLAMLRRNPRLRIFALHDCTRSGCALAHKLATDPEWFRGQTVVDVGLRPAHARNLPNLIRPGKALAPALGIAREELEWLQRYNAELAVLRPEQVLRRLFHAMNKQRDDDQDDGFELEGDQRRERRVSNDDNSFSTDSGLDDGGADSFG
jgi:DNA-directed RNA polymerase subunit RPC12/RpoP